MNKLPAPFYEEEWGVIYHGDCREILPLLKKVETISTDPVWPNALAALAGSEDPVKLFREFCSILPADLKRLVIEMGCDSDPRFLQCVPASLPIIRVCWLEYLVPSYKGRILYTGDVAYAFGEPPPSIPGRRLLGGRCTSRKQERMFLTAGDSACIILDSMLIGWLLAYHVPRGQGRAVCEFTRISLFRAFDRAAFGFRAQTTRPLKSLLHNRIRP
ncbi:hypothetical protein LCGC14_1856720 [marine sediment metagenome]|uniref:Uncharacterized protein n=1 Tax=marine sediment metagenome TaxID=412755 RepID=A0A0F9GX34_9ZZZZ